MSRLAWFIHERDEPLLAYSLWAWEEKELGDNAPSEQIGPALYNQGIALQTAGFPVAAELVFRRLIASNVNDQDAGTEIMIAARNYRHSSARSMAESYLERGLFLNAMMWDFRAMNEFEFNSWCGTCNRGAASTVKRALLIDAFMAGPIFFTAVLLSSPLEFGLHWVASLVALIVLWRRWRRLRLQAAAGAVNVGLP